MKGSIVTLENKDRWYISDETSQNGTNYYLGLKVDDDDEPLEESCIFYEEKEGDNMYLNPVENEDTLKYLGAIFVTKFNDVVDDLANGNIEE